MIYYIAWKCPKCGKKQVSYFIKYAKRFKCRFCGRTTTYLKLKKLACVFCITRDPKEARKKIANLE